MRSGVLDVALFREVCAQAHRGGCCDDPCARHDRSLTAASDTCEMEK